MARRIIQTVPALGLCLLASHLAEGTAAAQVPESAPPEVAEATAGSTAERAEAASKAASKVAGEHQLLESMLTEQASAQAEAPKLEFFGFADFLYRQYFFKDGAAWGDVLAEGAKAQFMVGNLNLYLRGNLSPQWTSLAEVRFHFSPVADRLPLATAVQDPTTPDFADPEGQDQVDYGRSFDRGSIEIERAYIEYNPFPWLSVRAGRFLTPYGVWNVDHGSPVLIDATRPYIIGDALFPEAQTGFNVLGEFGVGRLDGGYHVTLSNGRGPIEQIGDLDKNKGLGSRLWLRFGSVGELTVGASGYYGTYTDRRMVVTDVAARTAGWRVWERYRELGLAADLRYSLGGFLFVSEFVTQQAVWDDDARPIAVSLRGETNTGMADRVSWGAYGLAGYRFNWFGLMPFVLVQWYDQNDPDGLSGVAGMYGLSGGLNARVVPAVVLKLVLNYLHSSDAALGTLAHDDIWALVSQIAWAF